MNPFADRAAAAEFARVLEDDAPASAAHAPLATVVQRLATAAPEAAVRPEFRDALRTRLVAVATVQAARVEAGPVPSRRALRLPAWRSAVAVGGMASVIGVTGMAGVAAAGTQSLPGDPFYGVKRTGEAVSLRLTDGPLERGERHLQLAATRLDEVAGLTSGRGVTALSSIGGGVSAAAPALSPEVVTQLRRTLQDMDASTRAGGRDLMAAARASGSDAPLTMLSRFTARQGADLAALMPALPVQTHSSAHLSMAVVGAVSERVAEATGPGAPGAPAPDAPTPGTPGSPTAPVPTAPTPSARPAVPTPAETTPDVPDVPTPGVPTPGVPTPGVPAPGVIPAPAPAPAPDVVPTSPPVGRPVLPTLPSLPVPPTPTVELPGVDRPAVELPLDLPTLTPPTVTLPTVTLPTGTLPTGTLPTGNLPGLRASTR